jgi:HAD superfamily hydrolase (TIGR01484 family)
MLIYLFWFLFMTLLNLNQADLSDIRLIASDVDGTLTQNSKFSSNFISTLINLQSAGMKVLLVTGRSAGWVSALVNYLPVAGAIAENGGVFLQPNGQQDGCDLNIIQLLGSNRKPILIELVPKLLPTS